LKWVVAHVIGHRLAVGIERRYFPGLNAEQPRKFAIQTLELLALGAVLAV